MGDQLIHRRLVAGLCSLALAVAPVYRKLNGLGDTDLAQHSAGAVAYICGTLPQP